MAKSSSSRTTSPETDEAPARQTRRQQRIDAQRRQIAAVRREQRRTRAIWGSVILVALAVVIGLTLLLVQPPPAAQGRQVPSTGLNDHVAAGTPINSPTTPPTSGTHYPTTSGYGVFEREIEPGYWVHTLEHGGIVVLYHPDQCDEVCLTQLRDVYNSAPPSQRFPGVKKMAVIPYAEMQTKIAVVAWGWIDEMNEVDKDRILAFHREHVDRGPEAAL